MQFRSIIVEKIFVGVAWPYANGSLHLGHIAGSLLAPDIFARYHRLKGNEVLMVSGSDEHGTPITIEAEKQGKSPQEIVDFYHKEHVECLNKLQIEFDFFSRTTSESHAKVVQEFFLTLLEKGWIYKKKVTALYCKKCARWLPDRYVEGVCPFCKFESARGDQCEKCGRTYDSDELLNPRCKICSSAPEQKETEHFFLKLSALKEQMQKYIESKEEFWKENVYRFTLNWIKELKDRAITRDIDWGVRIPLQGYENKRIYVWFEAVIGYLSASKDWSRKTGKEKKWEEFWKDKNVKHFYFIGKDNIPFHTVIWPAMLLAHENLNLPYNVPANEYLTLKGEQFSKSRGRAVWLPEFFQSYEPDALRYYLSINMPETKDIDFTWDEFITKNNTELVAALGNFIHRVLSFSQKNFGKIPDVKSDLDELDKEALERIISTHKKAGEFIERCEFKNAFREIMALAHYGNYYFDKKAPWKSIKDNPEKCQTSIHIACRMVKSLAVLLYPFMPGSAEKLQTMLNCKISKWAEAVEDVKSGKLENIYPLFKKIELKLQEKNANEA